MLRKKKEALRTELTIIHAKILFPTKNVVEEEGGTSYRIDYYSCKDINLSIKITIPRSKILGIEKYNFSFQNISYKKYCRRRGRHFIQN